MRRLFAVVFVLAVGLTARAESPVKVISIEGVTEYRLANGAAGAALPGNLASHGDRQHDGPRRQPATKVTAKRAWPTCSSTWSSRARPTIRTSPSRSAIMERTLTAPPTSDRTNYFETMPANDKNLEFGIALECDRLVNSFIKRDDLISEMPVVRNEFERGENNPRLRPRSADSGRGLRMAQLRQIDDRQPLRHRAGADRKSAGLLPQVLPAR